MDFVAGSLALSLPLREVEEIVREIPIVDFSPSKSEPRDDALREGFNLGGAGAGPEERDRIPLERVEEARESGGRLERGGLFKASTGREEVRRSFEANRVSKTERC